MRKARKRNKVNHHRARKPVSDKFDFDVAMGIDEIDDFYLESDVREDIIALLSDEYRSEASPSRRW